MSQDMYRDIVADGGQFEKSTQPPKSPKKTKTSIVDNTSLFQLQTPLRLSMMENNRIYCEYMMDSKTRTDKLATVDDNKSQNFDSTPLVGARNYAPVGSNAHANPDRIAKLSNERVKIELTKEFFSKPEHYINGRS